MKKLKILFYTDAYLPSVDGTVKAIVASRKELERRGHKVYVFTAGAKETQALQKEDKRLAVFRGVRFRKYPQYTIAMRPQYRFGPEEIKPDIIHFHTPFNMGILALNSRRLTGAKLVGSFHTLVFSDEALSNFVSKNRVIRALSRMALMRYLRWLYSKPDVVIAPSNYTKNILVDKLRLKSDEIEVIASGVELPKKRSIPSKAAARKKLGLEKKDKVLLYFGRVSPEKNLDFLLKACKTLEKDGFKIIIAGGGPCLERSKALSAKYGLKNTVFTGFVEDRMKNYYYAAADVFCNPSLFETFSIVDIEAMAIGIPILVPADSAQADFINRGRCGEVFEAKSTNDLVKKAILITRNPKAYNPEAVAQHYSVKNTVNNLLNIYYNILSE